MREGRRIRPVHGGGRLIQEIRRDLHPVRMLRPETVTVRLLDRDFPEEGSALGEKDILEKTLVYMGVAPQLDETPAPEIAVPDVTGKSVGYVRSLFASMGLNLRVSGSTASGAVAVSQSIPLDTVVEQGTLITVEFVNKNLND